MQTIWIEQSPACIFVLVALGLLPFISIFPTFTYVAPFELCLIFVGKSTFSSGDNEV